MTAPSPYRTVLAGLGRIATTYADDPRTARHYRYATHAQVLSGHPRFAWVGAADPDPAVRQAAGQRWNPGRIEADAAALADLAPEVLVLATPPGPRLEVLLALAPSLKAVLVEKPLGTDLAAARAFAEACRERDILVQVNYWRRGDALYQELAGGDLARDVGRTTAVFGVYGGGLRNNGSHMIDFLRMLFGEVRRPAVLAGTVRPRPDGDMDAGLSLALANGAPAVLLPLDFTAYREIGLDIWGDRGRLAIGQEGLWTARYPLAEHRALCGCREVASDAPEPLAVTVGTALWRMYDNLADSLDGAARMWSPMEQALAVEDILAEVEALAAGERS